jgi:hypothetical protein
MKLLFISMLLISSVAFGQSANKPIKVDSLVQASDSTVLFTVRDFQPLFDQLKKLPYEMSAPVIGYMQSLIMTRVKEWEEAQNKPKKK